MWNYYYPHKGWKQFKTSLAMLNNLPKVAQLADETDSSSDFSDSETRIGFLIVYMPQKWGPESLTLGQWKAGDFALPE